MNAAPVYLVRSNAKSERLSTIFRSTYSSEAIHKAKAAALLNGRAQVVEEWKSRGTGLAARSRVLHTIVARPVGESPRLHCAEHGRGTWCDALGWFVADDPIGSRDALEAGHATLERDRAAAVTSYQAQAEFRKALEARAPQLLHALRTIAELSPHLTFSCSTVDYFEERCAKCVALRAVEGL